MEAVSALSAIGKLWELLNKLLGIQEVRRKALFDELLKPTFEAFQDVHMAYRSIFLSLLEGVDEMKKPGEFWIDADADELPVLEAAAKGLTVRHSYESLINQARKLREESHSLRFSLRSSVSSLLVIFSRQPERRYLLALALYFIDEEQVPTRPQELDHGMDSLIEQSGSSYLATPSMRLIWKLESSIGDRELFRQSVQSALRDLDRKYFLVASAFNELKYSIISNASAAEITFKKA